MADPTGLAQPPDEDVRDVRPGAHARQASEASIASFTFIPPTLPSYLAPSISHEDDPEQRHHQLGILEAIALVVGMQIGSGIFSSPGVIVHSTKSVGSSLVVWLVSGLLTWTGASSFAELGSMIPQNGGAQAYLFFAVSEYAVIASCTRILMPFQSMGRLCLTSFAGLQYPSSSRRPVPLYP